MSYEIREAIEYSFFCSSGAEWMWRATRYIRCAGGADCCGCDKLFPLAKIVETIGGEYVTVENLAGGQEVPPIHSPRDLQKMREADVVVVLGGVRAVGGGCSATVAA